MEDTFQTFINSVKTKSDCYTFESTTDNILVFTIPQRKRDSVSELLSIMEEIKNNFVS